MLLRRRPVNLGGRFFAIFGGIADSWAPCIHPHGGVVTDISRGLSDSDTPGQQWQIPSIPEGCQNM